MTNYYIMQRRSFFKIAGGALTIAPFYHVFSKSLLTYSAGRKIPLIIDADTANEIDDLYAITRALLEAKFDVMALSSGQWRHRLSPENTVIESQKLNEDILHLMKREDIQAPMGSDIPVGMPWGGTEPRESAASETMIRLARELPEGQRLIIVSLGAVTNVASAVKLAPDIIPKIECYFLSGKFFSATKIWDKDEFNARRDLNAMNVMLNAEGLDIHIMPINILYDFRFKQSEIIARLENQPGVWDYLAKRWLSNCPQDEERIFWDLALIIALAKPELAEEGQYLTPPENTQRKVYVYTKINVDKMKEDWWHVVEKALKSK